MAIQAGLVFRLNQIIKYRLWVKCGIAESKMWNQKCGMTLIGPGNKPRDRWLSADYHTSLSTDSAVKCRPEVQKSLAMEADSVF